MRNERRSRAPLDGATPDLRLVLGPSGHDQGALLEAVRDSAPGTPLIGFRTHGEIAPIGGRSHSRAFLAKPFTPGDLLAFVAAHLQPGPALAE